MWQSPEIKNLGYLRNILTAKQKEQKVILGFSIAFQNGWINILEI